MRPSLVRVSQQGLSLQDSYQHMSWILRPGFNEPVKIKIRIRVLCPDLTTLSPINKRLNVGISRLIMLRLLFPRLRLVAKLRLLVAKLRLLFPRLRLLVAKLRLLVAKLKLLVPKLKLLVPKLRLLVAKLKLSSLHSSRKTTEG